MIRDRADRVLLQASAMGANKHYNQDWSGTAVLPLDRPDRTATLLAVADGHGAKDYPRSDLGSRFAVAAFERTAARYFADTAPEFWRSRAGEQRIRADFPAALALHWRRLVVLHAAANPPGAATAGGQSGRPTGSPAAASAQTLRLYGSTLICTLIAPGLFAAWQIGDGDLFVAGPDGSTALPLAPAVLDLGDETDSLCHPDAADRFHTLYRVDEQPALVSLSTDGLSKSFASQDGFIAFCTGLFDRLRDGAADSVAENLPNWLARSAAHSGDDSTLCAAYGPVAQ